MLSWFYIEWGKAGVNDDIRQTFVHCEVHERGIKDITHYFDLWHLKKLVIDSAILILAIGKL